VGEFSFEFQNERSVNLEIEVSPNDWVLLISPPLDRFEGRGEETLSEFRLGDTSTIYARKPQDKRGG